MFQVTHFIMLGALFLIGCAELSPEELKARQDNAFDLSGSYTTTGDVNMNINIENQGGKKYDILIKITRSNNLTREEQDLIEKATGANPEKVTSHFENFALGEKKEGDPTLIPSLTVFKIHGGENISRDFGKSSEFGFPSATGDLCTGNLEQPYSGSTYEYEGRELKNKAWIFDYCISGKAIKKDKKIIITGELKLNLHYKAIFKDNDAPLTVSEGVVTLNYTAESRAEATPDFLQVK